MDMILMLVLLAAVFFISLTLICLYRDSINVKVCNIVFIVLDVIFYFVWNLGMYESGWFEQIYNPLENISPMIFTVIPLTLFMNEKTKQYVYSAIAFLWIGMFVAFFLSPEQAYVTGNHKEATFAYTGEALCHMLASLFGIYLILTRQVKLDVQNWLRALAFIYAMVFCGVFLNYFFHQQNFGMDPYGDYSIYFLDIFGTFEATFMAYLFGIIAVLTIGLEMGYLIDRVLVKHHELIHVTDLMDENREIEPLEPEVLIKGQVQQENE